MPQKTTYANLHAMRISKLERDIDESERLGIPMLFMQMSALSPSSRPEHVERHGQLFTGQQLLDWWASGDNSKGCRCSCTPVLVDASGSPITPGIISRAKAMLDRYRNS